MIALGLVGTSPPPSAPAPTPVCGRQHSGCYDTGMGTACRLSSSVLLFLLTLGCGSSPAQPSTLAGKVVAVFDGDSLQVLVDGKPVDVRIHGIDAPERGQAFSTVSRRALSNLLFGKAVTVRVVETDRYGRRVGHVSVDGVNAGLEQLRGGLVWHYTFYSNDARYAAAERDARAARRGLWQDASPVPPWEFRQRQRGR